MRYLNQPKLTLIGAGPGDPDLITVKGLKRLAEAAVVLYDALVNTSLLRYVPSKAKKVFVGKREGYHVKTQDEINTMIVELAREYGNVVRLKGGDPFIFSRDLFLYRITRFSWHSANLKGTWRRFLGYHRHNL
jgi:uroporphyrin-III C-methyltransferase